MNKFSKLALMSKLNLQIKNLDQIFYPKIIYQIFTNFNNDLENQ